jgi:hypothetical protein
VKAGWGLIVMGVLLAVWLQHADAVIAGIGLVALGAWILSVKEPVR